MIFFISTSSFSSLNASSLQNDETAISSHNPHRKYSFSSKTFLFGLSLSSIFSITDFNSAKNAQVISSFIFNTENKSKNRCGFKSPPAYLSSYEWNANDVRSSELLPYELTANKLAANEMVYHLPDEPLPSGYIMYRERRLPIRDDLYLSYEDHLNVAKLLYYHGNPYDRYLAKISVILAAGTINNFSNLKWPAQHEALDFLEKIGSPEEKDLVGQIYQYRDGNIPKPMKSLSWGLRNLLTISESCRASNTAEHCWCFNRGKEGALALIRSDAMPDEQAYVEEIYTLFCEKPIPESTGGLSPARVYLKKFKKDHKQAHEVLWECKKWVGKTPFELLIHNKLYLWFIKDKDEYCENRFGIEEFEVYGAQPI